MKQNLLKGFALVLLAALLLTMGISTAMAETKYSITTVNCKAYSDDAWTVEISSAEAGTEVYLKPTQPAGKYWTGWTPEPSSLDIYEGGWFTMPAEAVTVTATLADQTPYTIDLTGGSATVTVEDIIRSFLWSQGENGYTSGTRKYDLDSDGNDDVDVVCNVPQLPYPFVC